MGSLIYPMPPPYLGVSAKPSGRGADITFYRLSDSFNLKEKTVAKTTAFARAFGRLAIGPIAGAFGLWLLSEFPAVHASICMGG